MIFISEDNKTINLPVPLGSTVFRVVTDCNYACLHQEKKFEEVFPNVSTQGRCNYNMPCHTKLLGIRPEILSFTNLGWILADWNIIFFATENEAKEAGNKLVEEHNKKLLELGLQV